ncbi:DUF6985 domain-containing protein [Mesorhizobium helmanticense]|uniref:DUF6985 domain-containing protein n=1 Tax=Mesorhizobium helmanticense TaxID=1776423 RepID=A0A2T4ITQ4_9HYPH|nr:hypothetical protein [Mesorhizobium helmanticense]PTE08953.1 hypothetical protein C9427_18400 [Mesorhizobium helmanticense]
MKIPGLGECRFDERNGCYVSEPISLAVMNGDKCRILVEGYDEDPPVEDFHKAIANFLEAPNTVLRAAASHIFKYYLDVKANIEPADDFPSISSPSEIWQFVQLGGEAFVSRRPEGDNGIYVSLECNCDWEPEHGLQIVFKNGAVVNKVGSYDGHLTNSDAYADSTLENVIYR